MHKTLLFIFAVQSVEALGAEVPKSLSLSQAAKQFFATEPSVAQAQLAAAVAEVGVLSAQDRASMNLAVTPNARADAIAGGVVETGGITGGATADFRFLDRFGGTVRTQLNARTVTAPTLFLPGNGGTLSLQYAIPLLRNRLASLWAMEVAQAQFAATAAKKASAAMRVERCAAFLHLFVTAQALQDQTHILEELLQRREQTYARTAADYNKKLLTRLDVLASKSDLISARQRLSAMKGHRQGSLSALWVALGQKDASAAVTLQDEVALRALPSVPENFLHPELEVFDATVNDFRQRAVVAEKRLGPEVSLLPEVGASLFSHQFVLGNTAPTQTRQAWVGLGLGMELPFIAPDRVYQPLAFRRQAEEWQARKEVRRRELSAAFERAQAQSLALKEQLQLLAERIELAQNQVQEARATYLAGRLPFQDYLQHFVVFEESRLQQSLLALEAARADIEAMAARGVTPSVCQEDSP